MPLDERLLSKALAQRDRLLALRDEGERAQAELHRTMRRMHAAGTPLRELAEAIGMSHQRVHQIVDETTSRRRGPRWSLAHLRRTPRSPLDDLTGGARQAIDGARREAARFGHDYLGTEHLLIALADGPATDPARKALVACGATPDRLRDGVLFMVGPGCKPGTPRPRPTDRLERAVLLAAREAGDRDIKRRHLLLGLLAEPDNVGRRLVERLGCTTLRQRLAT